MKDFVVKDTDSFQLRVQVQDCPYTKDTKMVRCVRSIKDSRGQIENTSTYDLYLTQKEMDFIAGCLTS
jgi:hypothetical protein